MTSPGRARRAARSMRWMGTGHQVPRASTIRAAHGASGLMARRASTEAANAATALIDLRLARRGAEREQHGRVGPGRLQADGLEHRRGLAGVGRAGRTGRRRHPALGQGQREGLALHPPGRDLHVAGDPRRARAVQPHVGHRQQAGRQPVGQGAHARRRDRPSPRRRSRRPPRGRRCRRVLGAGALARLLQPALDQRVQPRARPHGQRPRPGGAPTGPPPTATASASHPDGVHRDQAGRLAGVDHHPRLGPRAAGRRHEGGGSPAASRCRAGRAPPPPARCPRAPPPRGAAGSTKPSPSTGTRSRPAPSRTALRQAAIVAGCSTALATMWRPEAAVRRAADR